MLNSRLLDSDRLVDIEYLFHSMIATYAQIGLEVLLAIGGIIFAVAQWKNGKDSGNSSDMATANDTIQILQRSVDTMRQQVKELTEALAKDHDEIIRLQEQLKHKEEKIEEYQKIFEHRNPELDTFMKFMVTATEATAKYQQSTSQLLTEMQELLAKNSIPMK